MYSGFRFQMSLGSEFACLISLLLCAWLELLISCSLVNVGGRMTAMKDDFSEKM